MRTITVKSRKSGSAKLEEIPEPHIHKESLLLKAIAVRFSVSMLAFADQSRLQTWSRGLKPENFMIAFDRKPDDIKVVVLFSDIELEYLLVD